MSARATGLVWQLDLPMTKKHVLLKYADNANERGECWPSRDYVARVCNCSLETVKKYLRELRDEGVMVVVQQGGGRRDGGRARTTLCRLDLAKAVATYGDGVTDGLGGLVVRLDDEGDAEDAGLALERAEELADVEDCRADESAAQARERARGRHRYRGKNRPSCHGKRGASWCLLVKDA